MANEGVEMVGNDLRVRISCGRFGRRAAVAAFACAGALAVVAPQASAAGPPAFSAPADIASHSPVLSLSTTPETSYNWSGYVAQESSGATFTAVTTTYKQPVVTCPVAGGWTVFWVGFDGWGDNTVEQDGTSAQCVNGQATPDYYAWWEMYPTNSIQPMSITVNPGDKIKATVTYTTAGSTYTMTVADLTNGQQGTKTAKCQSGQQCLRSVAEWIVERPTLGGGNLTPLAKWKTFTLNGDKAAATPSGATLQPIKHYTNDKVTMVSTSNGATLAKASKLSSTGASFTSTFVKAQ